MAGTQKVMNNIIDDIRVALLDEFQMNFKRKAFFDKKWKARKSKSKQRGSLLNASGGLSGSLRSKRGNNCIIFSSSKPYANIHNKGGKIKVTEKMKRYFWAMYYKAAGGVKFRKSGERRRTKRNIELSEEAEFWRNMALMRVGSKITIPQRQFLGDHKKVREEIKNIYIKNINECMEHILKHNK